MNLELQLGKIFLKRLLNLGEHASKEPNASCFLFHTRFAIFRYIVWASIQTLAISKHATLYGKNRLRYFLQLVLSKLCSSTKKQKFRDENLGWHEKQLFLKEKVFLPRLQKDIQAHAESLGLITTTYNLDVKVLKGDGNGEFKTVTVNSVKAVDDIQKCADLKMKQKQKNPAKVRQKHHISR